MLGLQTPRGDQAATTPLLIAPFEGFIKETLDQYPKLCGARVFDMIVARGYTGRTRTVRRHLTEVASFAARHIHCTNVCPIDLSLLSSQRD